MSVVTSVGPYRFYSISVTPGMGENYYYGGFGKADFNEPPSTPGLAYRINLQHVAARTMLSTKWQCFFENSGLFYFYNNAKRIFTEALFRDAETVINASDVKQCARLMLNIPSTVTGEESQELFSNPSVDFPSRHPMNSWMRSFHEHLTDTGQVEALDLISSEERAYRLSTPNGLKMFSIPVAKYESEETFNLVDSVSVPNEILERFNREKYNRTRALFETNEAKTVVDYIFPIRRYMSLASVYSTSILGGYNEVPNLMSGPKASLALVLYLCSINSRARLDFLEDVDQSEFFKKSMDNMAGLGNNSMDCFDFPFNEDLWEQFKEQLLTLIKQIPSIILRGIADVLDPAYKEMKLHWQNCDIKHLRNSGWSASAHGPMPFVSNNANIQSGLMAAEDRMQPQGATDEAGNGVYVPIIPAAAKDLGLASFYLMNSWIMGFKPGGIELRNSLLRIVSYVYKGPASLVDPSMAFKIPCLDLDLEYKEKWNAGKYGRYGHPLTPFSLLALMTPEINSERIQKQNNCPQPAPDPLPDCEDTE